MNDAITDSALPSLQESPTAAFLSSYVYTEPEVDRLFDIGCLYFEGKVAAEELLQTHNVVVVKTVILAIAEIAQSRSDALRALADRF